ncbi:uncharacterized protein LOC134083008 isoform X2 [Sardina pilchardus]
MTEVVDEAKDHCTTAWTCNITECAFYDYEVPEKDAMMFEAPVVNASFETVVIESQVEPVVVTVECLQEDFIAKNLPCLCKKSSSSPPSIPTNQNHTGDSERHRPPTEAIEKTPDTDVLLKTVLPLVVFVIVTVFGSVAVIHIMKRRRRTRGAPGGQQIELQAFHPDDQQQSSVQ